MDLKGVGFITAAASGIGRGCAIVFAREGCQQVVISDVNEPGLQETKRRMLEINPKAAILTIVLDVSDRTAVEQAIERAVREFGRVDYAVNVAGLSGAYGKSTELPYEVFELSTKVTYFGTWNCQQAEIKQMLKQEPLATLYNRKPSKGSIVNISSNAGIRAVTGLAAYSGAKHAIVGITKVDAVDYIQDGIRVNAVCPGLVMTEKIMGLSDELKAHYFPKWLGPANRGAHPEEIGEAVVWLSSSRASYMNGAAISVDGGYSAV